MKAGTHRGGEERMQDSKGLYSKCFAEYRLSYKDLHRLQQVLLTMLVDIKTVCDRHQINYMLCGGTTLGAVRHQGFIPWDDDVDVMMLRSEFNRFKKVFRDAFSEKYELVEPLSDPRYVGKLVKIYKKGTTFIEIPTAGVGGPDMIFVDLFLIENLREKISDEASLLSLNMKLLTNSQERSQAEYFKLLETGGFRPEILCKLNALQYIIKAQYSKS